jgi:hypothetical protein
VRCAVAEDLHLPRRDLTIIGYKFHHISEDGSEGSPPAIRGLGDLYAAKGTVQAVYPVRRDRVMVPFPAIEITCGSLGGMSGGAVLDSTGHLMGIISTGVADITYAAWVVGSALAREIRIPWPPGLHPETVRVLDIPDQLLRVEGREAIAITAPNTTAYRVWFDPPALAWEPGLEPIAAQTESPSRD